MNPFDLAPGVEILKLSKGLLALAKPSGLRSQPKGTGIDNQCLIQRPYNPDKECFTVTGHRAPLRDDTRLSEKSLPEVKSDLYLLHRLDSPTSGVVVCACEAGLAAEVRESFAEHRVRKVYYAWVKGVFKGSGQIWRDRLTTEKRGGQIRSRIGAGLPAVCRVTTEKVISGTPPLTLLRLEPETGRPHQLRVQCAHRRLPIVGDATYGDFALNRISTRQWGCKRLCLHASDIEIPLSEGAFSAHCPFPQDWLNPVPR